MKFDGKISVQQSNWLRWRIVSYTINGKYVEFDVNDGYGGIQKIRAEIIDSREKVLEKYLRGDPLADYALNLMMFPFDPSAFDKFFFNDIDEKQKRRSTCDYDFMYVYGIGFCKPAAPGEPFTRITGFSTDRGIVHKSCLEYKHKFQVIGDGFEFYLIPFDDDFKYYPEDTYIPEDWEDEPMSFLWESFHCNYYLDVYLLCPENSNIPDIYAVDLYDKINNHYFAFPRNFLIQFSDWLFDVHGIESDFREYSLNGSDPFENIIKEIEEEKKEKQKRKEENATPMAVVI